MKKSKLAIYLLATLSLSTTYAQNNIFPTTGNTGVGTTVPNFSLQVHGSTNYVETDKFGASVNYGVTSRIGLTNSTTLATANDGLLMRMSGINFKMENKENGGINFQTGGTYFSMNGAINRIGFGGGFFNSTPEYASTNIIHNGDNGLFIQTQASNKYGLSIRSQALTDNAIQVMGTTGTAATFNVKSSGQTSLFTTNITGTSNAFSIGSTTQDYFSVKGSGLVSINYTGAAATDNIFVVSNASQKLLQLSNNGLLRLRKVRVDSDTWADFVFDEDYKLMPLDELKSYLTINNHLPNVPSTSQVQEEGIDLAEMNKTLLQKVEELTLYILQQQEEIEAIKKSLND